MDLGDRIHILSRAGLPDQVIAAILGHDPASVAANRKDPAEVPASDAPLVGPSIIGAASDWADRDLPRWDADQGRFVPTPGLDVLEAGPATASSPALGQDWRDETVNRARGQWYQLSPDRAVQINWTFWQNSNAAQTTIDIRIADNPANWQTATWITPTALVMHGQDQDSTAFTSLIPPGMYVQAVGDSGVNFRKALELTL